MIDERGPFERRTTWILVVVGAVSLIGAVVLGIFAGELGEQRSAGADGYSRSAIGHALLRQVLEEAGVPVLLSRHDSAARAQSGVLVIAEPVLETGESSAAQLRDMIDGARTVVVVLPKRRGTPDRLRPGWVSDVELLPVEEPQRVLAALAIEGKVERSDAASTEPVALEAPQTLGFAALEPHTRIDAGVVIGKTARLYVISDPDLINNHGLGKGTNVEVVVNLLRQLAGDGPVVFDETLHGFRLEPSPFRALFTPPLLYATVAAFLASFLLLWAAVSRFGPPLPVAPAISLGKDELIRNTAALMRFGGHDAQALVRYFQHTLGAVRAALHRPRLEAPALEDEVLAGKKILHTARRVHDWREEQLHGHRADPRRR